MIKIIVDETIENQRLDAALAAVWEGYSRSKIQSMVKNNDVKVNGVIAKSSLKLKYNDIIEVNRTYIKSFKERIKN